MTDKLTVADTAAHLAGLRASVAHDPCWTCDCLQGFLAQLELDAEEGARPLFAPLKAPRGHMHG